MMFDIRGRLCRWLSGALETVYHKKGNVGRDGAKKLLRAGLCTFANFPPWNRMFRGFFPPLLDKTEEAMYA